MAGIMKLLQISCDKNCWGPKRRIRSGELRVIIMYTRWYHKFFDFYRKFFRLGSPPLSKVGELRFSLYFDKHGSIIEGATTVNIGHGGIDFINEEVQ